MLMDRLYKSEKQLDEIKGTYEAVVSQNDNQKDKKIIDLAKRNRALQLQAESLKTKAAKAAEFALSLKKDQDKQAESPTKVSKQSTMGGGIEPSSTSSFELDKRLKESDKRVTKLRNENQE